MDTKRILLPVVRTVVAVTLVSLISGCVGLLSAIGYWTGGSMVDADYGGLKGKKVAVVCVSESSALGAGSDSVYLANTVGTILSQRMKDVKIVPQEELADWVDQHGWNGMDFAEIGRGARADMVLAIELTGLGLYEGQTLYKGKANLNIRVLDMKANGKEVFRRKLPEVTFPTNAAYSTTDTSEARFRRAFLDVLAQHVARRFYDHEFFEDFNAEPASLE